MAPARAAVGSGSIVLLVDGDADRRAHASAVLRAGGAWVIAAAGADEAIAVLGRIRPSLLLTVAPADRDLCAHLGATRALSGLPIVVMAPSFTPAALTTALERYNAPTRP